MTKKIYDVLIIGGGINGTGIARDAAGRGLSVCLIEKDDLASGTSSKSTKLIHGGLRYLEYYEFSLVRNALSEREVLWRLAPHIVKPFRLVLPHHKDLRPKWLLRLGLFLYDYIGGRKKIPTTKTINLKKDETGKPLKDKFEYAFEFSDCTVDDSRLTIINAISAKEKGATILTKTKCLKLTHNDNVWTAHTDNNEEIVTKLIINAGGPWVSDIISKTNTQTDYKIKLVKGSHIIVPKIFDHNKAYFFQNNDNRIAFCIPYFEDFTLIGTTDVAYNGSLDDVFIEKEEVIYLCDLVNNYLKTPITPTDVISSFAGIRPLLDDGASKAQAVTRDHKLEVKSKNHPPILNIYGGKITSYRKLAEEVITEISTFFPEKPDIQKTWSSSECLPGGDFNVNDFDKITKDLYVKYDFIKENYINTMFNRYGTNINKALKKVNSTTGLGIKFDDNLYQFEVDYLIENEWAKTVDDILFRRTKVGLIIGELNKNKLKNYINKFLSS